MKKKILIIDDEPDVIAYLVTVLEANGFETYSSSNAKNGIELLQDIKPDLICLDIMMPHETGFTFYKKFRKNEDFCQIPVIIISGVIDSGKFNFRNYVKDNTIKEPEAYLEKPINVEEFIQNVNHHLEN